MDINKIPKMEKEEYDQLVNDGYLCRIAFKGDEYPYIAPFLYVFDGRYMYFLPTLYGRKIDYFRKNSAVSVEVEDYLRDLSRFTFISLQGSLEEVKDAEKIADVRKSFLRLLKEKELSPKVLAALGYSPNDPPEVIVNQEKNMVWRLAGVKDIVALKNE